MEEKEELDSIMNNQKRFVESGEFYISIGKLSARITKVSEDVSNGLEELKSLVQQIKIPSNEEIKAIADSVVKEPEIINQIVKEVIVKEPILTKETVYTTERVEYDDAKLIKKLDKITKEISLIKIPEQVDLNKFRKEIESEFAKRLKENIDVLGLPNFRKLAMGLQAQIDSMDSGGGSWGSITGTLSNQTDLQNALDTKANSLGSDDNYVTDAEKVKLSNLSGTNSGDNAVNTLYSGLVSNATHTGDATGATALTVVKIQGKDFPTLGAPDDQKYPKYVHGSNAFVMTAISGGGDMLKSENLSGLADYPTARTNLGLGTLATQSGTFSGTSSGTNTGDQTSIVGITGSLAEFNTALTGADFATLAGVESLTNKKLGSLTSNGFVKTSAGDGTLSVDTNSYQTLDTQLTSLAALTYAGNGGKYVRLNAGETDFELATITGGGDVSKVGTPANNQIGVWTGDGTLEGDIDLTFDTTTNLLTTGLIAANTITANTAFVPDTDGGADLGTTSLGFQNLHLNTGATVNIDNGDWVSTHTSGTLTVGTGDLRVTNNFTNATSVVTLGGAQTLTNKTLTSPIISSISNTGTITIPTQTGTLLINTSTAGVGTSPIASQTDTVTHNLGRVPTMIRIYGIGTFTANAAATPTTFSIGIWNSSGNRNIYQRYDPTTITVSEPGATSTTWAIRLDTGVGNFITGVIQNVTSTGFDIVWTETGAATAQVYMWEAQ